MHKSISQFITLLAVAASMLAVACRPTDASFNADLNEAREAIDGADYLTAQSICDHLYSFRSGSELSATQLARLSILYMDLSNASDGESQAENIAAATQCYIRAFELNPDSASAFYSSLSGGYDIDRLRPLNHIVSSVTGDDDDIHEEPDSTVSELDNQISQP